MTARRLALVPALLLAMPVAAQSQHSPFSTGVESASMMTPTEIREHNKALSSKDANYIRCRKFDEIGSLVRKARVCKTNAQWTTSFKDGNQNTRDTIDAMNRAPINSSN